MRLVLHFALFAAAFARSVHEHCEHLRNLETRLDAGKDLAWLGDECAGGGIAGSKADIIASLKELLGQNEVHIHRSVKQFSKHLENQPSDNGPAKIRTNNFFRELLPERPSTETFAYFYQSHTAFTLSLHRLRWELAKNELFVELGRTPELENQKLRNGLKDEAEYQLHWLKFLGCRLRTLAELEGAPVPEMDHPSNDVWEDHWSCDFDPVEPNVLHESCLTRNKLVNVKLNRFLGDLKEFLESH